MKKIAQIVVIVVLAGLLVAGGFMAVNFYTHPLAEPMNLQTSGNQDTAAAPATIAATVTPTAEAPVAQAAQTTETCGQSGVMRVLLTGADFSMGQPPLGADAVRLMKIDFDQKAISVAAFPRDMLLKTPGLADLNIAESRLGLAYNSRKEAAQGDDKHRITEATGLVAQTLYDNFAYPAEKKDYYYLTLQLNEIGAMIDAIGGVQVNLPESMTTERKVTFPAGEQTLDGKLAVEYLRAAQPGGDAARLKRQNLFIKAMQAKVLSADVLTKVPDLYEQFDKAVVTDLSPKQIETLACMTKEVSQQNIAFHEIGVDNGLVTANADGALIPDVEKIKAALKVWFGE